MIRRLLPVVLVTAGTLLPGTSAVAFVAPGATIVSASLERQEQGDDTTLAVALSAEGRHAVFQTRARNLYADDDPDPPQQFRIGGIFRRDLVTGSLEIVADGDLRAEADPEVTVVRGAQNPSVSADGRFVAFATGQALVPQDANGAIDVYVRDMTMPRSAAGAYELVSARDGTSEPATFVAPEPSRPGLDPGADVTARAAISADGNRVVFRALAPSDLLGVTTPPLPAGQVLVRDRAARSTTLLTVDRITGEPAGGSLGAATISGDGSTALWVGREAPAQTVFVDGEGANPGLEYYLYRRIADGPAAPTRRITGIADPDDPACAGGSIVEGPDQTGPCYGPLAQAEGFVGGIVTQVPSMSADGRTVAFVTTASRRANLSAAISGDLFVTDMSSGLSRKASTVELTRDVAGDQSLSAAIDSVTLSPEGTFAVLTSSRTQFPFGALGVVGTPRANANAREVYLVDVGARTIERILRGFRGEDTDGAVNPGVAVSRDARRIAFVSAATNLFFGDANDRLDAFVVDRTDAAPPAPPEPEPPAPEASPPVVELPPDEPAPPVRRLAVTVRKAPVESVRVAFRAPAAGTVQVRVRGRRPDRSGRLSRRAVLLASRNARATRAGRSVVVTVAFPRKDRARLRAAGQVRAQAQVTLLAGDERYTRTVTVVFRGRKAK